METLAATAGHVGEGMTWWAWAIVSTALWGAAGMLSSTASKTGTVWGVWAGVTLCEALVVLPVVRQVPASASWAMVGVGVMGALAYGAFFMALRDPATPVAPVVAITAMYPLVTAVMALLLLNEHLSFQQWAGVVLAVAAGVLIVQG